MTLSEAAYELRVAGHSVEPSDIPGLVIVDGIEMTMNQVKSEAEKAKTRTARRRLDLIARL